MKKLAAVAAMTLFAASAYASGPGMPSVSITGHAGTINGTAASVSTGSSVVATQWAARSTGTARKWSPARASTPPASRTAT
ncbi:hypothetical protein G6F68_021301 [Rhizopus microsporus]|nr:hypothetical protein G6F68_021301 [Rhizopus microsporus]